MKPDDEANAHLIAAAPELLEACKEMRDVAAAAMQWIVQYSDIKAFLREVERKGIKVGAGVRVDKAIAKAEGR